MKKRKWLSIVLALVLVLPCILTGSGIKPAEDTNSYAIASRPFLADSFEELREASDVMLIGQVVSQYPEQRHDMVFTYSRVQVSEVVEGNLVGSSNLVEVLQTGGTLNGTSTPALADEPLMTVGENYLLCLSYSPADGQYPAYYLPTGGGQGILSFVAMASTELSAGQMSGTASGLDQVLAHAESVFDNGSYGCCQPMSGTYGDSGDPRLNGHWPIDSVGYHIYGNLSIENLVERGFDAWNDCGADFEYYSTTEVVSPDVMVYCNDYGTVNWEALTTYKIGALGQFGTGVGYYDSEYYQVKVQLHSKILSYSSSKIRGIACHEAGHALGMGHVSPLYDEYAVMVADTEHRTGIQPSAYEKGVVVDIYGE